MLTQEWIIKLREIEKPIPKDNEALIKVHAASLDAADLEFLKRGKMRVRSNIPISGKLRTARFLITGLMLILHPY